MLSMWCDGYANQLEFGDYFTMCTQEDIKLCTLNIYNSYCQLHFNKANKCNDRQCKKGVSPLNVWPMVQR